VSWPLLELTEERRRALEEIVANWSRLHPPPGPLPVMPPGVPHNPWPDEQIDEAPDIAADGDAGTDAGTDKDQFTEIRTSTLGSGGRYLAPGQPNVDIRQVEILHPDRPGLVDVLATVDGRTAHAVLGLRRPGDSPHFIRTGEEAVLGLLDDDIGLAVVVDALSDAELAVLLLDSITGHENISEGASMLSDEPEATTLAMGSRTMTVFGWPADGFHPGCQMLLALDEAGFNHLPAPVALWRREGRDLGLVQEQSPGTAGGWALALTSLRDLYASGGEPDQAGGDFGPEAHAIGVMTARMHLALDRAYGRQTGEVSELMDNVVQIVQAADPELGSDPVIVSAIYELRAADLRLPVMRTHGDLNLGRIARTDLGWVVADVMPGGRPPGAVEPLLRSPLADVADMLWSLHHVASVAAAERDPSGRGRLEQLARNWETRNRRALLSGYLSTPGIGGLVPTDRAVVRNLAKVFEVERAAIRVLAQGALGTRDLPRADGEDFPD
jgi:maltokinase